MFGDCDNIGIATGQPSGVFVVDLDGDEGVEQFEALERLYGDAPATLTAQTGVGLHFYFRLDGHPVRNRQKMRGMNIDCRGTGGYVVCPPSIHPNGLPYVWLNELPPAVAPDWVVELVLNKRLPHGGSDGS